MTGDDHKRRGFVIGVIIGAGGLFLLASAFGLGLIVGTKKAQFSYRMSDSYRGMVWEKGSAEGTGDGRAHRGPSSSMRPPFLSGGHGAGGEVISRTATELIVLSPDNVEKIVALDKQTRVVRGRGTADPKDIKTGDIVIAIGSPTNEGRIKARLLRILEDWSRQGTPPMPPDSQGIR